MWPCEKIRGCLNEVSQRFPPAPYRKVHPNSQIGNDPSLNSDEYAAVAPGLHPWEAGPLSLLIFLDAILNEAVSSVGSDSPTKASSHRCGQPGFGLSGGGRP